jgi:transcriptional regulator with XRE-family HTH domain
MLLIGHIMSPIERVAERLQQLRKRRKWTQAELADKAGLSRGYLARLETARQDPTLTTLEALARALGVKVSRLLD